MARRDFGLLLRICVLLVAGLLAAMLLAPAKASTVVPGGNPDAVIDIPKGDFVLMIAADASGRFNQRYRNSSGAVIDRLTFRFAPALPASPKAQSGVFGLVSANRDLVNFDLGASGTGIPRDTIFRIRMGGLAPFTASAFGPVDPGPFGPGPDPAPVPAVPVPPAGALLPGAIVAALLLIRRRTYRIPAT